MLVASARSRKEAHQELFDKQLSINYASAPRVLETLRREKYKSVGSLVFLEFVAGSLSTAATVFFPKGSPENGIAGSKRRLN